MPKYATRDKTPRKIAQEYVVQCKQKFENKRDFLVGSEGWARLAYLVVRFAPQSPKGALDHIGWEVLVLHRSSARCETGLSRLRGQTEGGRRVRLKLCTLWWCRNLEPGTRGFQDSKHAKYGVKGIFSPTS